MQSGVITTQLSLITSEILSRNLTKWHQLAPPPASQAGHISLTVVWQRSVQSWLRQR